MGAPYAAGSLLLAIASIAALRSQPVTRPVGPLCAAASLATVPGPQATSMTASPASTASSPSSTRAHGSNIRGTITSA